MSEEVTLWTFQYMRDWEELQEKGVLRREEIEFSQWLGEDSLLSQIKEPRWELAYFWMAKQMRLRIPDCRVEWPIWAWFKPSPDLQEGRFRNWLDKRETGVCIEFKANPELVLLSEFDAWNIILNNDYLALNEKEYDNFHFEKKQAKTPKDREQLNIRTFKSWERVFNLELITSSEFWAGGAYIQACVEEIRLEQVVEVKTFKGKAH